MRPKPRPSPPCGSSLPHPPLPLAQQRTGPSIQAKSLRVTWTLLFLAPTSKLSASPVGVTVTLCRNLPTAYHLPGPQPGLGHHTCLQDEGSRQPTGLHTAHCCNEPWADPGPRRSLRLDRPFLRSPQGSLSPSGLWTHTICSMKSTLPPPFEVAPLCKH